MNTKCTISQQSWMYTVSARGCWAHYWWADYCSRKLQWHHSLQSIAPFCCSKEIFQVSNNISSIQWLASASFWTPTLLLFCLYKSYELVAVIASIGTTLKTDLFDRFLRHRPNILSQSCVNYMIYSNLEVIPHTFMFITYWTHKYT